MNLHQSPKEGGAAESPTLGQVSKGCDARAVSSFLSVSFYTIADRQEARHVLWHSLSDDGFDSFICHSLFHTNNMVGTGVGIKTIYIKPFIPGYPKGNIMRGGRRKPPIRPGRGSQKKVGERFWRIE